MSAGQLLKQANQLKRAGRLDEAIDLYYQAIDINPNFAWTYYELGDALNKNSQHDEAAIAYQRAIDTNQKSVCFSDILEELLHRQMQKQVGSEKKPLIHKTPYCYRYLDLIKSVLLDEIYGSEVSIHYTKGHRAGKKATPSEIESGSYWPSRAHTMIGRKRLDNIQYCVEDVIDKKIDGDLIETGVWRGGATIFMKALLEIYNIKDKVVYVADSFEGLPPPDPQKYPVDSGDKHHKVDYLKASLDEVKANFSKYNLLDDRVKFVKGFFENSLVDLKIDKISVLRLDGDMYSSTIQVLSCLYDKVAIGGYIIIDDYALHGCKAAVDDFRKDKKIKEQMITIDWTGTYWQKTS